MSSAFDKIIGYQKEKDELMRICAVLKHRDEYEKIGVKAPNGLMLDGAPGVGKTLMAKCLIEESGCECIEIKKDRPKKEFIELIKSSFEQARQECAKSGKTIIVFMDDIDKFTESKNSDAANQEEFAVLQSEINSVNNMPVFVLATVNDCDVLPDSLKRRGRFDKKIVVCKPKFSDASKIFKHYLDKIVIDKDELNSETVAKLANNLNCADIESIVKEAGFYTIYDGRSAINMDDMVRAIVKILEEFDLKYAPERPLSELQRIAYHEAGHAAIALLSKSIEPTIVCMGEYKETSGITRMFENECDMPDWQKMIEKTIIYLGGKAAEDVVFNDVSLGCQYDIDSIEYEILFSMTRSASFGFDLYDPYYASDVQTPVLYDRIANKINEKLQYYYDKSCEILRQNRPLLDALANALLEKNYLTMIEMNRIFDNYKKEYNPTGIAL